MKKVTKKTTKAITKTAKSKKVTKISQSILKKAHAKYEELRMGIRNYVRKVFDGRDPDFVEEIEQSVQVYSYESILSLAQKGRLCDAYATTLAQYGIRRYMVGRPGGLRQSSTDVTSPRCQYLGRSKVKHYGLCEHIADTFQSEATVVDGRYPVHKTVALRIDFFETWLANQSRRDQEIIKDMAYGETTNDLAMKYGVSAASISCYRRKYADSWYAFINPPEKTDWIEELRELAAKEA